MIRLVAFDLDGTIADTIPMCIAAFEEAVSPYVGHTLSKKEIIQTFGLNEIGMIKTMTKEHWEEALHDFYIKYDELHFQCDKPFDGVINLIEKLKAKGIIVALITGKGEISCKITLEKLKMSDMFSEIITGSEYRNCKKDALLYVMKKYDLSAHECIYVGDAISDVTASNEAGIKCISAAWSESADKSALSEINFGNVYKRISELSMIFD